MDNRNWSQASLFLVQVASRNEGHDSAFLLGNAGVRYSKPRPSTTTDRWSRVVSDPALLGSPIERSSSEVNAYVA